MDILLVNFKIYYCAKCGRNIYPSGESAVQDFFAHASHTCRCGTKYQYVSTRDLIVASGQDGDMPDHLGDES